MPKLEPYRIVDATPPAGFTYDDFSDYEVTVHLEHLFVEAAEATAEYYLGG